ncbi:calpain-D-like [Argopecten irradians]|uniref:calpain-D-like n=1 Tax=Argopecten irradians TaxID=31199 RepID=UPI003711CDC9
MIRACAVNSRKLPDIETNLEVEDTNGNMSANVTREVKWTCQHCTLQNENIRKRCAVCHQQRTHIEVTIKENDAVIGGWTCKHCRFDNTIREQACKMCKKRNNPVARLISEEEEFKVEEWHCKQCTFVNPETLYKCNMCDNPREWQTGGGDTSGGATGGKGGKGDKVKENKKQMKDKEQKGNDKQKISKAASNDHNGKGNDKENKDRKSDRSKPDDANATSQWRCKVCTFLNSQFMEEKCEMCESVRPSSAKVATPIPRSAKRQRLQQQRSMRVVDLQKKEETEAMKRWINITNHCKEKKTKFTDADFPHDTRSLYLKPRKHGDIPQWRRCGDITTKNPKEKWVVYRENPLPDDIQQGYLGNCWYLSALAVLADRKELLEKMILTKTFCQEGAYHLRLCKDGCWKIVLVDDVFPCDSSNRLLYSRSKRKQLWVPLIEKAAAKLFGCYQALTAGHTVEALSLLTGEPCEHVSFKDTEQGDKETDKVVVWSKLVNARESKFLMGTSCGAGSMKNVSEEEFKKLGLISCHAYSLLDVQDVQGNQLVRIRNPWGRESWNGDWSDGSKKWSTISASSKKELNPTENENGIFWMGLDDFMKYFDSVDICKVRTGWHEVRIKGVFPPDTIQPWKFVNLSIIERTQMDIGLFQKSFRGQEGTENTLDLFIVVMENDVERNIFKRVVTTSRRQQRSFVGCEVDLYPGFYTIACLAFKHWQSANHGGRSPRSEEKLSQDFLMSIHSSQMILSEEIDSRVPGYSHALADILIHLAIQYGKRSAHGNDGLFSYTLYWHGAILVVENTSKKMNGSFKCDASGSSYVVSTRRTFVTLDCVLPRHRQVITVLTPLDSKAGSSCSFSFSTIMSQEPGIYISYGVGKGKDHEPAIPPEIQGLHQPRPIL